PASSFLLCSFHHLVLYSFPTRRSSDLCCLKYENDTYEDAKRNLPDVGERVVTQEGAGRVIGLNILEKIIRIELEENNHIAEFSFDEIIEEDAVILSIPE